jgi:hypothetical protein
MMHFDIAILQELTIESAAGHWFTQCEETPMSTIPEPRRD